MQLSSSPRLHMSVSLGVSEVSTDKNGHSATASLCRAAGRRLGSSALYYSCRVNKRLTAVCCRLTASLRKLLLEPETLTPVWLTDSVDDTQRTALPRCHS